MFGDVCQGDTLKSLCFLLKTEAFLAEGEKCVIICVLDKVSLYNILFTLS